MIISFILHYNHWDRLQNNFGRECVLWEVRKFQTVETDDKLGPISNLEPVSKYFKI